MSGEEAVDDELLEAVREDPDLEPAEKETIIKFDKLDDEATIFSEEAGVVRRLLAHPHFTPDWYALKSGERVESTEAFDASEGDVVAVEGTAPIGCLKLRESKRSRDSHALIITHTSTTPGEEVREA